MKTNFVARQIREIVFDIFTYLLCYFITYCCIIILSVSIHTRVPINLAVLSLIESGELTELFNKWWFEKTHCDSAEKQETARNELSLKNVAGIFFILIGGLIVSLIVALIEFFVNKPDDAFIQHQQSHHHHHHNHQRMHHPQQQMHLDQQQQIQQHNSVVQATDTMKSKLTIQPTCEYDNGTVGVSYLHRRMNE